MNKMHVYMKYIIQFRFGFSFLCVNVLFSLCTASLVGIPQEYCLESFNPECSGTSVVVIQQALYGRMKMGKCIKVDYGNLGCSKDQLSTLDAKCSGRKSCDVFIPSPEMTAKLDCLNDLTPYLEARYTCQEVYAPKHEKCVSPERIPVDRNNGYISSLISKDTQCGSHSSPWILEAKPGQSINISLLDFAWNSDHGGNRNKCPENYGYILDLETDDVINICGRTQREKHLYTSVGHSVQVVMDTSGDRQFLIQYKGIGCPEYKAPSYAWVERENNSLIIGCHSSDDTWTIRCVDNMWLGIVGTCDPTSTMKSVVTTTQATASVKSKKLPTMTNNHVTAFAMGCITLIICCLVVILGIYCAKRYEVNAKAAHTRHMSALTLPRETVTLQRVPVTYKPVTGTDSLPKGTMDLPPYSLPLSKEERPPTVPHRMSSYGGTMPQSMVTSDYLDPQGDGNSVQYYILENPAESGGSDQMYQSIHMMNSTEGN